MRSRPPARTSGAGFRRGAAQKGAHPGHEFLGVEGLGKVIVRALVQAVNAVGRPPQGRHHQHRDALLRPRPPQEAKHAQAVGAGQHAIENHQTERALLQQFHGLGAVGATTRLVAGRLEVHLHQAGDRGVVLDDEDEA